ncbi:MAG TPA: WXG100 family type VII secretion target [Luteimicrobium sp.]|nr:WXG100 family type VII secretion target [Luteimicrobium sp.]
MSRFEVDSARVALAAGTVERTAATVRSEVAAMLHQLQELQATWQGAAAERCAELVAEWRAVQARVEEVLDGVQVGLARAARTYEEAEASAAALFGR